MPRSLSIRLPRALAGLAAACLAVSAATATAAAPAKPLKKVTITVGTQVLNVAYPWLMLPVAKGYWRDEGYDVEVIGVSGSAQGLQQLATGGIQFAQLNSTGLIQANTDANLAVRGILGTGVIDWGVAVMEDSPIKKVSEFKGKRIGIVSLATGGYPLLKGYLRNNGVNPDTEVQIIAVGAGAPALDALKNNRVQGLMFWQSALTGFENAGAKLRVFRSPDWRNMPDFTLGTMQKTIDSDTAMVEAIARGAAKGWLFAMTNPDCARKVHWAAFPSTKPTGADEATLAKWDLALLNAQLDTMRDAHKMNGGKLIGAMDLGAYGRFQDFMFQEKLIKRTLPAATFIIDKPGFIEAVNRFDHEAIIADAKACK
ncbi:MAG: ABC transporter substrate-binding protein [Pigmentiphaga sp.]|uniref:ABC transporter substrate-binding protein n=1 Tax=Pigmentiphaga sp. TaxID=1977564 RepID=UPI003B573FFE